MSPRDAGVSRTTSNRKNASALSRIRRTPRDGDVLASGRTARADIHAISVVPADAHMIVARYPDAIERVRALARGLGVDGWYTSDQTHYARVATYRLQETEAPARLDRRVIGELSG